MHMLSDLKMLNISKPSVIANSGKTQDIDVVSMELIQSF